jgi:sporulation protein YlmC with PRC-barrel domain
MRRMWTWWMLGIILLLAIGITLAYQARPRAAGPQPLRAPFRQSPALPTSAAAATPGSPSVAALAATAGLNTLIHGTPTPKPAPLLTGTTVIGRQITTSAGQRIGEVASVAVNPATGAVPYAILSFGQPLEHSVTVYGVAMTLLDLNPQHEAYVLNADRQKITDGPGINRQVLTNGADLPADFRAYVGMGDRSIGDTATPTGTPTGFGSPVPAGTPVAWPTVDPRRGPLVLLNQLIGWPVWNRQSQQLGSVQDFVFDEPGKHVRYLVLALGNKPEPDKKLVVIPLELLHFEQDRQIFTLDINRATLAAAPGFTQATWPDTSQPGWDAAAMGFWQRHGVHP